MEDVVDLDAFTLEGLEHLRDQVTREIDARNRASLHERRKMPPGVTFAGMTNAVDGDGAIAVEGEPIYLVRVHGKVRLTAAQVAELRRAIVR